MESPGKILCSNNTHLPIPRRNLLVPLSHYQLWIWISWYQIHAKFSYQSSWLRGNQCPTPPSPLPSGHFSHKHPINHKKKFSCLSLPLPVVVLIFFDTRSIQLLVPKRLARRESMYPPPNPTPGPSSHTHTHQSQEEIILVPLCHHQLLLWIFWYQIHPTPRTKTAG